MSLDIEQLSRKLLRMDGRGYKAYKDIQGIYHDRGATLYVDHVQGDPFAEPSKLRVRFAAEEARLPAELFSTPVRRMALEDFLARRLREAIRDRPQGRAGSGKSGIVTIDAGGQEVLERTAVVVTHDWVEARLRAGLPAAGRRILGRDAEILLCRDVLTMAEAGLCWEHVPQSDGRAFVECIENHEHIAGQLEGLGLIAFVAEGAILPRKSGVSDQPMKDKGAVSFRVPDSFRVSIDVPNPVPGLPNGGRAVAGMGIPKGVTLIVGGGYHGKSTLLQTIERGVYPHVPGDGREYAVTCRDAVKIRAEDRRRVEKVDISPFINNLPHGRDTKAFSSDDASGSTSQAANIVEALEVGATVLLLDEDTSATNFMVRDARMQALVNKEHEPITPFVERVGELYELLGVSTIVVMGGCGDYFDTAHHVILMREYVPLDVTREAKRVAEAHPTHRRTERQDALQKVRPRVPLARSFDPSRGRREVTIDVKALDKILYGRDPIELRAVEQLLDPSQTRAIGHAIHFAAQHYMDGKRTLRDVVEKLEELFDDEGLDRLNPFYRQGHHPGDYARPRKYEITAAINRLRTVAMTQKTP